MASLNDGSVFSGANWQYPRWPITSGRWLATSFNADKAVSVAFIFRAARTRFMATAAFNKSLRQELSVTRKGSPWGRRSVAASAKQLALFVHRRSMLNLSVRQLFERFSYPFLGLRFRLLMLVLLVCAPLVVLTLYAASRERRRAVTAWSERAQKMTRLARQEEADLLGQARQLLLAMSESSAVRSGNREACKKSLDEVFTSYSGYANLGVTTTNGEVLASAVPLAEPGNQAGRRFFQIGRASCRERV